MLGGIPYTAHGAQIHTPLFSILSCSYAYFRSSQGQACPAGLEKSISYGPAGLEPHAGSRIRKEKKDK